MCKMSTQAIGRIQEAQVRLAAARDTARVRDTARA